MDVFIHEVHLRMFSKKKFICGRFHTRSNSVRMFSYMNSFADVFEQEVHRWKCTSSTDINCSKMSTIQTSIDQCKDVDVHTY